MRCRECGSEGSGNYCAQCGAPLEAAKRRCRECGAEVDADARYCTECGEPLAGGGDKPWTAYLPWALSALALVAFAVAITMFIQTQTSPRQAGSPPTGSLPGEDAAAASGGAGGGMTDGGMSGGGAASGGSMPSAGELANMAPREAADRLFDRAMRVRASGDTSRARFFARMGMKAYARVPDSEMDADARFHIGLLALVQGDTATARSRAQAILERDDDDLLGLILAMRSASDGPGRDEYRQRFLDAASSADLGSRPAYEAHRTLIENLQQELQG